ncbi:VOC family protein [Streptomyces flavofungini]|uniref:VOC family protein n=1 Tax=Streptomyces flavofungini TaxID=68200 RepID=UPI0034DE2B4A
MNGPTHGMLHHLELWVADLDRAQASLGWLLEALGHSLDQRWEGGRSWRLGPTYLVVEQSSALTGTVYDRCRPGLNHLAFHVADAATVDTLVADAVEHSWRLLFPERHPYAGGSHQYAAYLENEDGFEVELVAMVPATQGT